MEFRKASVSGCFVRGAKCENSKKYISSVLPYNISVVFCVTEMTETGYITHIFKPLENFPTTDAIADTRRIQKEIERWVLQFPDQYFWMHRRFKTRPLGEKSLYEP